MWSRVLGPDLACWSPEGFCVKRSRVPLCSSRLAPEEHLPTGNCTAHASAGISFPRLPPERYLLRLQRDRRESRELVSNILIVSRPFAALNFRSRIRDIFRVQSGVPMVTLNYPFSGRIERRRGYNHCQADNLPLWFVPLA